MSLLRLHIGFVLAGVAGSLAMYGLNMVVSDQSDPTALISLPWVIAGSLLISAAYNAGFRAGKKSRN